jgi:hypothetical protein
MSWQPRPPAYNPVAAALRDVLFDKTAVTEDGAGVNLVQALVMLAESAEHLARAIEKFRREET